MSSRAYVTIATFCFVASGWPHLFLALGFDFDVSSGLYALCPDGPTHNPSGHLGASDIAYHLHYHLLHVYRDVAGHWCHARMAAVDHRRCRDSRGKL